MRTLGAIAARFRRDERGLETVEYAIIAGLITGAAILSISAIGLWVASQFGFFQTTLGA
jgi:Flp pilus assembly pilin Flp